ncbi:MAG: DNA-formamidopyrimidine glycosylase family protein, partial [Candidatus Nanopelagicales bacterium]
MPELPEVEALAVFLQQKLVGRVVARIDVASISVLKTYDPPPASLSGLTVFNVARHGKFIDIDVDGLHLITHLARAGWLRWREKLPAGVLKPGKGPISFRVHLDDGSGFDLTEAGTQKSLAVYIVRDPEQVSGIARLGPDPLADDFDVQALRAILSQHSRTQLKGLLRDQSVIAGVGNAYSDEILHVAKLSPFRMAGSLEDATSQTLYDAMVETLRTAVQRSAGL